MIGEEMKGIKQTKIKGSKPQNITEKKLLIVEGKDEENFFQVLFKKKGIEGVQIMSVGGKDNFSNNLSDIMKHPEFGNLKSLSIVRDADLSAKPAFKSVCSALRSNGLPVPSQSGKFATDNSLKVGVFIIPDGKNQGMLESLCLSIIKPEGTNIKQCIDSFMECIKGLSQAGDNYKQPKKSSFLLAFAHFLSDK